MRWTNIEPNWARIILDDGLDERMDIVQALVQSASKSYSERLDAALWPLVASGVPSRSIGLHYKPGTSYVVLEGERVLEVPLLVGE